MVWKDTGRRQLSTSPGERPETNSSLRALSKYQPPRPMNVTKFGKQGLCWYSQVKMSMVPIQYDYCPFRNKGWHRQRRPLVKTEVETGVMCLRTKDCQGLLATPEVKRKVWSRFSPRSFQGSFTQAGSLIADLQNCERIHFCCRKLPIACCLL